MRIMDVAVPTDQMRYQRLDGDQLGDDERKPPNSICWTARSSD
jgi:hypothetical protein